MRVIAKELGFDGNSRRRPGEEFDYADENLPRDENGRPRLPKWLLPATDESRALVNGLLNAREEKMVAGARRASGEGASGGASKRKAEQFAEAVNRAHAGDKLKVSGGGASAPAPARSAPKGSDGK